MSKLNILNSLKNKKVIDAAKTAGAAGIWIAGAVTVPGVFVYGIPAFLGGMGVLGVIAYNQTAPKDPVITASADEEAI
jgi:hypothetical protein